MQYTWWVVAVFSTITFLVGAGNAQQIPAAVAALLGKSQAPGQPSLGPSSFAGEPHAWYQALHDVSSVQCS